MKVQELEQQVAFAQIETSKLRRESIGSGGNSLISSPYSTSSPHNDYSVALSQGIDNYARNPMVKQTTPFTSPGPNTSRDRRNIITPKNIFVSSSSSPQQSFKEQAPLSPYERVSPPASPSFFSASDFAKADFDRHRSKSPSRVNRRIKEEEEEVVKDSSNLSNITAKYSKNNINDKMSVSPHAGLTSDITFNGSSIKNIQLNSNIEFNNNDDFKRLTPKNIRSTSKTVRSIQRKESQMLEKHESTHKKHLLEKANNRTSDVLLSSQDIEQLFKLGFFDNNQFQHRNDDAVTYDLKESLLFDLVDIRKKSCRGVKTKALTASGEEASLSQV